MIKNKDDLKKYLRADSERYLKLRIPLVIRWLIHEETLRIIFYLKVLRYLEYYINVKTTIPLWGKFMRYVLEFVHRRQSFIYQLHIAPNVCGMGLRVVHLGGAIHLNANKIGDNCSVTAGVIIGQKDTIENRPYIGNNVKFTIGAKAIGCIIIGDNVIVAPNSVVIKDVPSNSVVSGVPAQIIKKDGKKISDI